MTHGPAGKDQEQSAARRWWARLRVAKRPLRRLLVLLILALIVEYLVIPELVVASKNFYLLGKLNVGWMIAGLVVEAASLFCYALLNRVLLPPEHRPGLSRLFRIDLAAAAVAHVIPAGTVGSAGLGYQLFTAEGIPGTEVGVMMATKGVGSTIMLNVLLWIALVISIPLSGFQPIYATVAIVGAVLLGLVGLLILGITRGEKRAARVVRSIGERIPRVGADRLERIPLQVAESLRELGRNRARLAESLAWAALNWLLDAASLWCFIAAFGRLANPVGLFAAYGIANVIGAIPLTPGGLGVIDTITPVLLVGFGLTRNVATLGVLSWRLVNFWLPIPTGAAAYISLKVPRDGGLRKLPQALAEMIGRNAPEAEPEPGPPQDGAGPRSDAERAETGEKAGSHEIASQHQGPGQPDDGDHHGGAERPEHAEQPDDGDHHGGAERPEHAEQPDDVRAEPS